MEIQDNESTLFIDGERRPSSTGDTYSLYNPARPDELVGRAASATKNDVDAACQAAHRAFPAWAELIYAERAEYLRRIADHLTADKSDLDRRVRLFTQEHGKILREAEVEMSRLGDRFTMCADMAERLSKDDELPGPPFDTIISRQPRGVAALIVPWNWPLSILGAKLPQALISGNTVVIKPSKEAAMAPSQTICKIAEMLPPGVVNLVTGEASRIGDPLLSHPLVRMINFTGSVPIGQHVMKVAADRLTPVTLELGGNDAGIILEDALLDEQAMMRMYLASFMSTGQICMALKRIYVHRSRLDEVVNGLTAIADRQVVGDGLLPETTMGPINNERQYKVVSRMIDEAKAAGADVRELGQVPDEKLYEQGYFQKPTLVVNADHKLEVVREEQFGPVVPIMPFDSLDEAINYANDSEFGLCSSVWSQDLQAAVSISRRLEAGYTYINGHGPLAQDSRGPFGGFKNSGIGRNLGYEGILAFQGYHTISAPQGTLF